MRRDRRPAAPVVETPRDRRLSAVAAALLHLDLRTSLSSGMTVLLLFVPCIAASAVGWGLPPLLALLGRWYAVNVPMVMAVAAVIVVLTGPMMVGVVFGFIMLDERDQRLAEYFPVTPAPPEVLLAVRLVVPGVLQTLYAAVLVGLLGLGRLGGGEIEGGFVAGALILGSALEAPLVALIVALRARNRLEGMTIAKALSLTNMLAIVALVLPFPQAVVGLLAPQAWFVAGFLVAGNLLPERFVYLGSPLPLMAIGLAYHALLLVLVARGGLRRIYRVSPVASSRESA